MYIAENKTIIDTNTYQDVCNAVNALKNDAATKFYFAEDNPFLPDIERLYQLKFKGTLKGVDYRCMMDLAVVDHQNKEVIPCDLKTSSHTEWDFYKSFNDWNYQIQCRLYWRLLKKTMEEDNYFKDFTLKDYRFIVVNKRTLTPLVWECPFTSLNGTLNVGKNNQIEWRDPCEIGSELYKYLKNQSKVPNGISTLLPNNLSEWINKL